MIPQSSLCCMGDGHGVTEGEKRGGEGRRGGLEGGHNSKGGNRQRSGREQGQGYRKRVQKRGESLKGFPFSPNSVCECAFTPSLNPPLRLSHTSHTIICYSDSPRDKEEEKEQVLKAREGRGEREREERSIYKYGCKTLPSQCYCPLHLPYDFKSLPSS